MNAITINQSLAHQVEVVQQANKTPWVTVLDGKVNGVYTNRTEAREAKQGKVMKYADANPSPVHPVAKKLATKLVLKGHSSVEHPCDIVRTIAAKMHEANPSVKRREVLDACKEAGVTHWTAHTKYHEWVAAQRNPVKA